MIRAILSPSAKAFGGAALFTVIAASGRAERLEAAIDCLEALAARGAYLPHIVIADCGLDSYGRKLAELLRGDRRGVVLCALDELPHVLEDCGWKTEHK